MLPECSSRFYFRFRIDVHDCRQNAIGKQEIGQRVDEKADENRDGDILNPNTFEQLEGAAAINERLLENVEAKIEYENRRRCVVVWRGFDPLLN